MSFRTVVISNRCKLDLRMNYMEVRGEQKTKVFIDDIDTLIIENPTVSLTGCLIEALVDKKVKVIFCDRKRSPQSELVPYHGSHDCSRKIKNQVAWKEDTKGIVWTMVVSEKIRKQAEHLQERGAAEDADLLFHYVDEMEYRDATNREGHAAKVYFNRLFGLDFSRDKDIPINAALDYGYGILLSSFNREIAANGYLTQLGLFHDNIYNPFNLSSDLMEPFRIIVDRIVCDNEFFEFETEDKHKVLEVLKTQVIINGTRQLLPNAIKIYVKSVLDALREDNIQRIAFYEL